MYLFIAFQLLKISFKALFFVFRSHLLSLYLFSVNMMLLLTANSSTEYLSDKRPKIASQPKTHDILREQQESSRR